jgi:hypothetical protein
MDNKNCCNPNTGTISGCMVCGHDLFCTPDMPLHAHCFYCGAENRTTIFCPEGHYVCDTCHGKDVLKLAEQICMDSDLDDPVELALCIFDLPNLHMHGPEYHSIVPAVLVAAYGNCANNKDFSAIHEAVSRGKSIVGGICGTHGACGAGIGLGIAYALIHKTTPYSKEERGNANKMTALALMAISQLGGPRCCKRDSMIAIETAKEHFGCFNSSGESRYLCRQHIINGMCIKTECPYYPA